VLTYVASCTISQERRRALANVFMGIDKNNSGSIDVRELHEAYKEVYQETDEAVVESIFKNIDTDGSGKIDFTEFLVVAEKQETLLQRESLLKAFEFFDIVTNFTRFRTKQGFLI
jgi:calcium-dependent protein kinase